jgi:hypothetical protein
MKDDFALIIGINDYTPLNENGLKTLHGAINDANYFEEWVTNVNGGNVPATNCFKITSIPNPLKPIQEEIDTAITIMINLIKSSGGTAKRLYFYFAGHGLGSMDNTKDTALCLANWSELRRNTALSSEAYQDVIRQFGYFEEIIFLVDCCRNTKINVKPMYPSFAPTLPNPAAGRTKLFVGYATQYQDQSFEIEVGDAEMRGVFTKVLIDGLKGNAKYDDKGIIDAESLKDYLIRFTPLEAQKQGFKQIPEIIHSFNSATPIVILANIQDKNVTCHILFNNTRNSNIELIDHSGVITSFDASQQKSVQVTLTEKLYLLRDTMTDEKYPILVQPSKLEIYVNF